MKSELQQGTHSSKGPLLLGTRENISPKKNVRRIQKSQTDNLPSRHSVLSSPRPSFLKEGTLNSGAEDRKRARDNWFSPPLLIS